MYRKILVPLDGSERAEKILPHVENLAASYKSDVILLRVVQSVIVDDGYKNILYQESMDATKEKINASDMYLNDLARTLRSKGLKVRTTTSTGPVVNNILSAALQEDVDLIALASHGRSGLGRVFYGSVAAGIIQNTDRPLLVIRSRDRDQK